MALISSKKQYKKLITFGCSYTAGFNLGEKAAWGYHLSQLLGCEHFNMGGCQTNYNIFVDLLDYCEKNDMTDCCVGIQFTDVSRREYWDMEQKKYHSFGLGELKSFGGNVDTYYNGVIDKNLEFFDKIWYQRDENLLRTIHSILICKNYLENHNIDFIMFEGIHSIMEVWFEKKEGLLFRNQMGLTSMEYRQSLLNDVTFFTELGDLHKTQQSHPDYNTDENITHPSVGVVKWWTQAMYDYIVKNS